MLFLRSFAKLKFEKRGPTIGGAGGPATGSAGSDLRHAAIDGEIHAGDERTFIGGEERDGSRDFLWLAPATHWDLRGKLGGSLLGLLRGKARRCRQGGGLDRSRAHRVHPDLAILQLQ